MELNLENLGDLQLRVLRTINKIKRGTVYDVLEALPGKNKPKYTTVLTVLRSLEKRGLLSHTITADRRYLYKPMVPVKVLEQGIIRNILKKVFRGSARQMVCTLLDSQKLSAEELAEIQRLIQQRTKGVRKK